MLNIESQRNTNGNHHPEMFIQSFQNGSDSNEILSSVGEDVQKLASPCMAGGNMSSYCNPGSSSKIIHSARYVPRRNGSMSTQ